MDSVGVIMIQDATAGPKDTGGTSVGMTAARARVLEKLRSRRAPWAIPELSDTLGLHRNTVREHLASLVDDGLAEYVEVRSAGPGRPARHYRATVLGNGIDYLEMTSALIDTLAQLPEGLAIIEQTGEAWGAKLAEQRLANEPNTGIEKCLGDLGFDPTQLPDGTLELRACPVLVAARRNPTLVCGLHRAVVRALVRPRAGEVGIHLRPWGSATGCLVNFIAPNDPRNLLPVVPAGNPAPRMIDSAGAEVLGEQDQ